MYVGDPESTPIRPVRELKGFRKILLQPGESKEVSFTLDKRSFAYWNEEIHDWYAETGEYIIEAGDSSRNLPVRAAVKVESTIELPRRYTAAPAFCKKATFVFLPPAAGKQRNYCRSSISARQRA